MAEASTPEPLAPDLAARVTEFARACKAAARAVSLYPPGHPAVRGSLNRLVNAAGRATGAGSLNLTVLPADLLVNGSPLERPDAAITELAVLLHGHLIGKFVVHGGSELESWDSLLHLLVRPPEELRGEGGIRQAWSAASGESIDIEEVDYAGILRERDGGTGASLEDIVTSCFQNPDTLASDDESMHALLKVVGDSSKLVELAALIKERAGDDSAEPPAEVVRQMLQALTAFLERTQPDQIDEVLGKMTTLLAELPADAMAELLAQRDSPEALGDSVNATDMALEQMADTQVAHFVAQSVKAEEGASERLAHAFQALVPEPNRQRQVLSLAEKEAAESPFGQQENFPELWNRVEEMVTSYSDEPYVSKEYARELSGARVQAVEVEQISDDPPERVSAWLATVADDKLRELDHQLLVDVLSLESDGYRWRDIANVAVGGIEEVARTGQFGVARRLIEAIARETDTDGRSDLRPFAATSLEHLATGRMIRAAFKQLRASDDEEFNELKEICARLGPTVINALADAMGTEEDARARRRLREIMIEFGAHGRQLIEQLIESTSWEVRRTAAYLLREFSGADGFTMLEPLLTDSESRARREAIRTALVMGDTRAQEALTALVASNASAREDLVEELPSMRDERAAPMCGRFVHHVSHRTHTDVYLAAIDALGSIGSADGVEALKAALYRGEWWPPLRTRALRAAAAEALRKTGTEASRAVLQEASASGPRGVRAAARAQQTPTGRKS